MVEEGKDRVEVSRLPESYPLRKSAWIWWRRELAVCDDIKNLSLTAMLEIKIENL
jgi:hypothetical protein